MQYYTSTHGRFFVREHPDFSKGSGTRKQHQHYAARRELLTSIVGGHVSLVQSGATSVIKMCQLSMLINHSYSQLMYCQVQYNIYVRIILVSLVMHSCAL